MIRTLLVLLILAAQLDAHDLWLIAPVKATANEAAVILAHQGMEFPKSTNAANASRSPRPLSSVPMVIKLVERRLAPLRRESQHGSVSRRRSRDCMSSSLKPRRSNLRWRLQSLMLILSATAAAHFQTPPR